MPSSKKLAKMADKLAEAIALIQESKTGKALTILTKLHASASEAGAKKAPKSPKALSAYQAFVKENMTKARAEHGSGAMSALASMWKSAKDTFKPKKSKSPAKAKSPKASAEKKPKSAKASAEKKPKATKPKATKPKAEKKPKASKPKSFYEFF